MNREPFSETMIRFQDCDPLGHLNNARYLDYFINARENHLADCYGLDIYDKQRQDSTNWVIAKTQIAFPAPVHKEFDARVRNIFRESLKIKQQEKSL